MLCTTISHGRKIFRRFLDFSWSAWDTETVAAPGYNPKKDALTIGRMRVVIFSVCHAGEAYSFPTNYLDPQYPTIYDWLHIDELQEIAETKRVVFHHANYDLNVFNVAKPEMIFRKWYCSQMAGFLANPAAGNALKDRAPKYGRHLLKTGVIDFSKISDLAPYAEGDVIQTDESYQMQNFGIVVRPRKIFMLNSDGSKTTIYNDLPHGRFVIKGEELGTFEKIFYRFQERPYLSATMRAEQHGFPFHRKRLRKIRAKIDKRKKRMMKRIYRAAGRVVNLRSNPDKVKMIQELKIDTPFVSRKTGAPSVSAPNLVKMQMRKAHPIINDLQAYTALDTLSKFAAEKGLEWYINPDHRIHAFMKTLGAITGRGSCSNPNLTQIPSKKDLFGFKKCFIPPKGQKLICIDYSQLELRIMAMLSGDPTMIAILNDPTRDIHTETANQWHVERDPVAKQINFLLQYAGTAWALAEKLTVEGYPMDPQQAQVYVDLYAKFRPKVTEYRERLLYENEHFGFVRLLTGRKRWLDDVRWDNPRDRHRAETRLSNNVVQGSGQDMLKASVIRCDPKCINPDRELPKKFGVDLEMRQSHKNILADQAHKLQKIRRQLKLANTHFALQVHDEAIYFADDSAANDVGEMIADVMTRRHFMPATCPYSVKMCVEGGIGDTWAEAKSKTPQYKLSAGHN